MLGCADGAVELGVGRGGIRRGLPSSMKHLAPQSRHSEYLGFVSRQFWWLQISTLSLNESFACFLWRSLKLSTSGAVEELRFFVAGPDVETLDACFC